MPVDAAGLQDREQILARNLFDGFGGRDERLVDAGHGDLADQFRMAREERLHGRIGSRLSDRLRHVQRVKIAGGQEAVHGAQADVIGVHVVGLLPAEFGDRRIGRGAHAIGLRSDDVMLSIRLVPDGDDFDAALRGEHAGAELRNGLVRKAISHTE